MLNVVVLVSGGGTNLQAIIDRIEDGYLKDCTITGFVNGHYSKAKSKEEVLFNTNGSINTIKKWNIYKSILWSTLLQMNDIIKISNK